MIDRDGFRANVGIILSNAEGHLLWARRIGQNAWQFPQGGIQQDENPEQAMYRELHEEVGLTQTDVEIVGSPRGWLRYRLPRRYIRRHRLPLCIGQKQVWFMLRLVGPECHVCLDLNAKPEFEEWRWVDYWQPLKEVVPFKRRVYGCALRELAPLVLSEERLREAQSQSRARSSSRSRSRSSARPRGPQR
jgi:putative (di)nucleoside polyphosphate hydrolase